MYIKKIILSNFRCFGETPTEVSLNKDITCLVGNNGSGKTSLLIALKRIFGSTREDRTIIKEDFHLNPNDNDTDLKERKLYIDVFFSFSDVTNADETYPAFTTSIYADSDTKEFMMRIRLEACWSEGEYEDEVESHIYWVLTSENVEFGEDSSFKARLDNYERKLINLIYIPASRDATDILKNDIKRLIKKIDRYVDANEETINQIESLSKELCGKVQDIDAIKSITKIIDDVWIKAHDNTIKHCQKTSLEATPHNFSDILKSILPRLSPSENGESKDIKELSDGQISLLYFSLSMALYEIEEKHNKGEVEGLKELDIEIPLFTILAFEEPENHLSPFYLSKIINLLNDKSSRNNMTTILTSHSPNVIRRIEKIQQIRFLRQKEENEKRFSIVNEISLPDNKDSDDYKFINQAILAHPELYFSKLVILGEGDSEEIVIPKIAEKLNFDLDPSFVSFVKLGGRHVKYMWRLLSDLDIPHITLIDFDLGRQTGGIKRVKDIIKNLAEIGITFEYPENINENTLTDDISVKDLKSILVKLRDYNMYFSFPLDLDMMMILKFDEFYKSNGNNSSREVLETAVFGKEGTATDYQKLSIVLPDEVLKKYRNLFCSKSKVSSHYVAINDILNMPSKDFVEKCPEILQGMIDKASAIINCKG